MEPALIITIGIILLLVGLVSCILPPLPGPPIAYISLLLAYYGLDKKSALPPWLMILFGGLVILISVVDNFIPLWSIKKMGGTKSGIRGSFIGMIVGIFFIFIGGWSILLCPFIGAIIGELVSGQEFAVALRSGVASFIGFLLTSGFKIILVVVMCILYFKAVL